MRAASSHALAHLAQCKVTAYLRCGAWATNRPRMLLRPCLGVAPTNATKQARQRIWKGVHPTAKVRGSHSAGEFPTNLHAAQTARSSWRACLAPQRLRIRSDGLRGSSAKAARQRTVRPTPASASNKRERKQSRGHEPAMAVEGSSSDCAARPQSSRHDLAQNALNDTDAPRAKQVGQDRDTPHGELNCNGIATKRRNEAIASPIR